MSQASIVVGQSENDLPSVPKEPRENLERPLSLYALASIAAFIALTVCLSVLAAYHLVFFQKQKIGTVDIAGVLETSEVMFTDMLSKPDITDKDRQRAYELVKQTGSKLDAAITDVQKNCDCILLTKAAVVGSGATDYTPQVKVSLGIDKVDVRAIQMRIRDGLLKKGEGQNQHE